MQDSKTAIFKDQTF